MLFKRITSNRDPRDTVYSEIKKEFRPYFNKAGQGLKSTVDRHPKFLFAMMVINIVLSAILCLTVFRPVPVSEKTTKFNVAAPAANGFDQILQASAALRQTLRLKKQLDSLTRKNVLTHADSALLWSDLGQLQQLKPFK
jgi:hypothetical protein